MTQGCSFVGKHIVEKLFTIPSVKDIVVFDKRKTFDSMRVTFLQRDILRKVWLVPCCVRLACVWCMTRAIRP